MRRMRRFNIRTLPRGAFRALCAFTLAVCLVLVVDARLRPAVRNIAMTRAKSLAVRTVGESIEKFIFLCFRICLLYTSDAADD